MNEFNEAYEYDKGLEDVLISCKIELVGEISKNKFELINKYNNLESYDDMINFCEDYNIYLSGLIGDYIENYKRC